MGVLALWRYPVKAMLGELLNAVEIGPRGCTGDRRWIAVDADTGERIANKRGPTDPRLRACRAELVDDSDDEAGDRLRHRGDAARCVPVFTANLHPLLASREG